MKNITSMLLILASVMAPNAFGYSNSCGALDVAKAAATIDMELELLVSGLYETVQTESMVNIANLVKTHLFNAHVCDFQTERLRRHAIESINIQVIDNPELGPYSINRATRIFNLFQNDVRLLESSANDFLSGLIDDRAEKLMHELSKRSADEFK